MLKRDMMIAELAKKYEPATIAIPPNSGTMDFCLYPKMKNPEPMAPHITDAIMDFESPIKPFIKSSGGITKFITRPDTRRDFV